MKYGPRSLLDIYAPYNDMIAKTSLGGDQLYLLIHDLTGTSRSFSEDTF